MESVSSLFRGPERRADPCGGLVAGADEFCVKISSDLDRRFWVRVAREPDDGMLVVTDFAAGERPVAELAAGLSIAVRALRAVQPRGLLFRDIVPGGEQTEGFPAKLVHAADLVKQLGAAVAEDLATRVVRFDMQPRRGKVDAAIAFAAAAPRDASLR